MMSDPVMRYMLAQKDDIALDFDHYLSYTGADNPDQDMLCELRQQFDDAMDELFPAEAGE